MKCSQSVRVLILDDDPESGDYLHRIVATHFPLVQIEVRVDPLISTGAAGAAEISDQLVLCIFDDDFNGQKWACRLACQLKANHPQCLMIAVSGAFSDVKRHTLLALGCDAVCDKSDPAQFLEALARIQRRSVA